MIVIIPSHSKESSMNLRDALSDISNDARGWLKAWAQDFAEAEARDSGGSQTNPVAWHLGHLACVEDDVYQLFSGKPGIAPKDVRAACGTGCPPPTATTSYPALGELWTLLDRTHAQWLKLIETANDSDFDRPPLKESPFFKTLGQAVYEVALHENYHVGEIATLRKALGKKRMG
jgi:hypothetical protein